VPEPGVAQLRVAESVDLSVGGEGGFCGDPVLGSPSPVSVSRVDWLVENPAVAGVTRGDRTQSATLHALAPGTTRLSARVTFTNREAVIATMWRYGTDGGPIRVIRIVP
jgi:hypothetical protein